MSRGGAPHATTDSSRVEAASFAIQAAVDAVHRRFGSHSLVRLRSADLARRQPTALRQSLPAWWPVATPARLIDVAGEHPGTLTLLLLWLAAHPGSGPIAWIDSSSASRSTGRPGRLFPPAAAAAGVDLRRLVVVHPPTVSAAVTATTILLRSEGFDVVLVRLPAGERLPAMLAGKLALLASQARATLIILRGTTASNVDEPAEDAGGGLGGLSDFRLRVLAGVWSWRDHELSGLRLLVRTEKARVGIAPVDHEFIVQLQRRGRDDVISDRLSLGSTLLARRPEAIVDDAAGRPLPADRPLAGGDRV